MRIVESAPMRKVESVTTAGLLLSCGHVIRHGDMTPIFIPCEGCARDVAAQAAIGELLRIGERCAPDPVMPTHEEVVLLLRKHGVGPEQLRAWLTANDPAPPPASPGDWYSEDMIARANADADRRAEQVAAEARS